MFMYGCFMKNKKCSKCGIEKLITDFYTNRSQSSGYSSQCKECSKEAQRKIYIYNPEKAKERALNYRERYRDKYKDKRKKERTSAYITESARKYGVTKDCIRDMLNGGTCEICGKAVSLRAKNFHEKPNIDHCHKTGAVRGLLCGYCNNLLGRCKDDVSILESAVRYLNERG